MTAQGVPLHQRGCLWFDAALTYAALAERFVAGAVSKSTLLTQEFDYGTLSGHHGAVVPPFWRDEKGGLTVYNTDKRSNAAAWPDAHQPGYSCRGSVPGDETSSGSASNRHIQWMGLPSAH
jgi:hypothetical protein